MLPENYLKVLNKIHNKLNEANINWVLTGSTAFIIQGIPLKPGDIDIQTDGKGAYKIENPVLDLGYESEAYMKIGRVEKAMLLKNYIVDL